MSIRTVTVGAIKQLVVDQCDIDAPTADTHVSDAMLTRWIALAVQKLYAVLNDVRGDEWHVEEWNVTTTAGDSALALPDEAVYVTAVVWLKSQTERAVLLRATLDELDDAATAGDAREWQGAPRYHVRDNKLIFTPTPVAEYRLVVRHTYNVPDAALADDASLFLCEGGWDDFLIAEVSARVYDRQEKDQRAAYARGLAAQQEQFIRETATARDQSGPARVRRIHGVRRLPSEGGYYP